jgi:hypothetical protein
METKTFLIVFFLFVVPALFGLLFGGSLANYEPPKGSLGAAKDWPDMQTWWILKKEELKKEYGLD